MSPLDLLRNINLRKGRREHREGRVKAKNVKKRRESKKRRKEYMSNKEFGNLQSHCSQSSHAFSGVEKPLNEYFCLWYFFLSATSHLQKGNNDNHRGEFSASIESSLRCLVCQ